MTRHQKNIVYYKELFLNFLMFLWTIEPLLYIELGEYQMLRRNNEDFHIYPIYLALLIFVSLQWFWINM